MKFKEKWDEIIKKMMDENPEDFEVDEIDNEDNWYTNFTIAQGLPEYVVNWPWIARKDTFGNGQPYMEVEKVNIENIEIDIFDDYVHVGAGGDWQYGTDFDLVLNKNLKTRDEFPFLACNIRYMADINGKEFCRDYNDEEDDDD